MQKNYDTGNIIIDIPESFIKEIFTYNDIFVNKQIETIIEIISNTEKVIDNNPSKEQIECAKKWCLKYDLPINKEFIYKA